MDGWRWWRWRFCWLRLPALARWRAAWLGWSGVLLAVLIEIMFTVYRDGVRDLTLLSKGYNVWDRAVVTNWCVVGLFLVLLSPDWAWSAG